MRPQTAKPASPKTAPAIPASQSRYPTLKPRPEQSINPDAERQQEQAQQQIQR